MLDSVAVAFQCLLAFLWGRLGASVRHGVALGRQVWRACVAVVQRGVLGSVRMALWDSGLGGVVCWHSSCGM